MAQKEYHYSWTWHLNASPEALWPLVSDTDKFNSDTQLPPLEQAGGKRNHLRIRVMGLPIVWEETPFEWVRPRYFGVIRLYESGPVLRLRVQAELVPVGENKTDLIYQLWVAPRNWLGNILIPIQVGLLTRKQFDTVFKKYGEMAGSPDTSWKALTPVSTMPRASGRLDRAVEKLIAEGAPSNVAHHLKSMIESGHDHHLFQIRPYQLADQLNQPRRSVLEFFLRATRAGLLELRWNILCPTCRGSETSAPTMSDIPEQVHCESCNIDYSANFEQSVELTFRPHPSIRPIVMREFCIGGPQKTPHVWAQQTIVSGGAPTSIKMGLEPGCYQLRLKGLPSSYRFVAKPGGPNEVRIELNEGNWPTGEIEVGTQTTFIINSALNTDAFAIIERTAWNDQAATAADVATFQVFRDLFSKEALKPRHQISVGTMTILFTDLRSSTRFYRQVGDAPAFGYVMDHFELLRTVIARHDGAIVKTIGDAVMAVFNNPLSAVTAALSAQFELSKLGTEGASLQLKAGIHAGSCIAVTLNERLDYFGSTVNIASRLVDLSSGTDIIISEVIEKNEEVQQYLLRPEIKVNLFQASLRGYDDDFTLVRVSKSLS
ncbi:MAG: adenylate/guanylate cyclase domain-containing protein [Verrucomicrobiota bacterium]|nr:adenylate/guanylate cyclase domain-containing protein [Verrucomicrobiota bacterium]